MSALTVVMFTGKDMRSALRHTMGTQQRPSHGIALIKPGVAPRPPVAAGAEAAA